MLALTAVIALILGRRDDVRWRRERGIATVGVFLAFVLLVSAFYYPIWTRFESRHRIGRSLEGEHLVDDRPQVAGVDAAREFGEVLAAAPCRERAKPLRHERRDHGCRRHPSERTEHPSAPAR